MQNRKLRRRNLDKAIRMVFSHNLWLMAEKGIAARAAEWKWFFDGLGDDEVCA